MLGWAAAALAAALVWLFYENVWPGLYKQYYLWHIPRAPAHLLIGHVGQLLATNWRSFRLMQKWDMQFGPVYVMRFLWSPVVVVTDPAVFSPFLRPGPAKLEKYLRPYRAFELMSDPPRSNILTSPQNAHWRMVRRAVAPAFTLANIKLSFPQIVRVTQRLVEGLVEVGPATPQDMDLVAGRLTVDVIGEVGFGRDMEATDLSGAPSDILLVMQHLLKAMQARNNPLNRWFPWRKEYRNMRYWSKRSSMLVDALLSQMEAHPPPPHTIGAHLLAIRDPATGKPLERAQLSSELGLLFGAGFETTAHTICWALFCLVTNPAAEQKVLQELDSLGLLASPGHPEPRALVWEDLGKLKYLTAALNESMRLYPVVSTGTARITHEWTRVGPYLLPPNVPIITHFYSIHRSPRLWPQADQYIPERWLDSSSDFSSSSSGAGHASVGTASPSGEVQQGSSSSSPASSSLSVADDAAAAASEAVGVSGRDEPPAADAPGKSRGSKPMGGAAGAGSKDIRLQRDQGATSQGTPDATRFLPFSIGPRDCVGQQLALVEVKVALAMLLGSIKFELTPDMGGVDGVNADAIQTITLKPEHGMFMYARHRRTV